MKPICVPCQRFYRMKRAGHYFIEQMPRPGENHAPPGTEAPDRWQPYKLWVGDLWECEGCLHQIVSGVGGAPISEHYKPDFEATVDRLNARQLTVNDC